MVERRQRVEQRHIVVIKRHLHLVADGGPRAAHVVGLPQRGDLREHLALQGLQLAFRYGDAVQRLEQLADAAALEHHAAPRHLCRVRREDGRDVDLPQQAQDGGAIMAGLAQPPDRAAQAAALRHRVRCQQRRKPAALAVVGFRQVDQLEVERERPRQAIRGLRLAGGSMCQRCGMLQQARGLRCIAGGFGFTASDGGAAQVFDRLEERLTGLLAQHRA